MKKHTKTFVTVFYILLGLAALIGAPLIGVALKGGRVADYLAFPPIVEKVDHAAFSPVVFWIILAAILIIVVPFFARVIMYRNKVSLSASQRYRFPAWGWIGVFFLVGGWILAWTRFSWMEQLQIYTYTPPWIGYIIIVNALTYMRTGRSMITHTPKYLLVLFITSAVFWWYYEYINQFSRNWYYVNLEGLSNTGFFFYATLPFATVLPAITGTWDLLGSFSRFSAGLDNFIKIRFENARLVSFVVFILSIIGLSLIPVWPDQMFPLVWLSTLLILASVTGLANKHTIIDNITDGNWKDLFIFGISALICGFFWEMWNYYSFARWEYAIPFVERYHIFEMPALGYAGYLPFGIKCGIMAMLVKDVYKWD